MVRAFAFFVVVVDEFPPPPPLPFLHVKYFMTCFGERLVMSTFLKEILGVFHLGIVGLEKSCKIIAV